MAADHGLDRESGRKFDEARAAFQSGAFLHARRLWEGLLEDSPANLHCTVYVKVTRSKMRVTFT